MSYLCISLFLLRREPGYRNVYGLNDCGSIPGRGLDTTTNSALILSQPRV